MIISTEGIDTIERHISATEIALDVMLNAREQLSEISNPELRERLRVECQHAVDVLVAYLNFFKKPVQDGC